jgi:hypothetical protein
MMKAFLTMWNIGQGEGRTVCLSVLPWAGGITQWYSACLACIRPQVSSSALPKGKEAYPFNHFLDLEGHFRKSHLCLNF